MIFIKSAEHTKFLLHYRETISGVLEDNEFREIAEKAEDLNEDLLTLSRLAHEYSATIEELSALTKKYHILKRKIKHNTRRLKSERFKMRSAK